MRPALLAALAAAALCLISGNAGATTVLYDNGPINGTLGAIQIEAPVAVADSFTLAANSTVTEMKFGSWSDSGFSPLSSVDWSVWTGNPFGGGTELFDGSAPVTSRFLFSSLVGGYNFDIYSEEINLGSLNLNSGNYYVELTNAIASYRSFWDEISGPSTAYLYENLGFTQLTYQIPSESFQMLSAVPEAATWAMMLLGLGGLGAAMRSRRKKITVAA
jgi:hypothetical protein